MLLKDRIRWASLTLAFVLLACYPASPAYAEPGRLKVESPIGTVPPGIVVFTGSYEGSTTIHNQIVYIVDVSGSTELGGSDCNADGRIDTLDDFNGDGSPGTTLDCEIAGVTALNASLRANPIDASLIGFGSSAAIADMTPGGGVAAATSSTADSNKNRVQDVQEVATSLATGSIHLFTEYETLGSGTNFAAPLALVQQLLDTAPAGATSRYTVYFISDGIAAYPADEVRQLASKVSGSGKQLSISVNTVSVGTEATGCAGGSPLLQISNALTGTCVTATPSQLQAFLGDSKALGLDHIDVAFAGSTVPATVDAVGNWTATFTDVIAAATPYPYKATAVRDDGTTSIVAGSLTVATTGIQYAALGDSFSSGNGLVPYFTAEQDPAGKACQRSDKASAYSVTLPDAQKPKLTLLACGGAQTIDIVGRAQVSETRPQLSFIDTTTTLVTLTIGGNDALFSEVLKQCALNKSDDCQDQPFLTLNSGRKLTLGDFAGLRLTLLQIDLLDTLRKIRTKAPNATVIVADYPHLISQDAPGSCLEEKVYSTGERKWIRQAIDDLGDIVQLGAKQAGIYFVSVISDFSSHEPCGGGTDWTYGIEASLKSSGADDESCSEATVKVGPFTGRQTYCVYGRSFHPKAEGTKAYGDAFSAALKKANSAKANGLNSSGLPRNPAPLPDATVSSPALAAVPVVLQAPPPTPTGITSDELAEVAGFTSEAASLSDLTGVQHLATPSSCGDQMRALPGQLLVLAGRDFKPGTEATPVIQYGSRPYVLPSRTVDSTGQVYVPVVLPVDTSAEAVSGFTLGGTGRNGYRRVATTVLGDGAGDVECIRDQRAVGLLSTDGHKLPAAASADWKDTGLVFIAAGSSPGPQASEAARAGALGAGGLWIVLAAGGVVLVLVVIAAVLLRRRRRSNVDTTQQTSDLPS